MPLCVDARTAGASRHDHAPNRRHPSSLWAVSVGVAAQDLARAAEPRRDRLERPVPRVADERHAGSALRLGERKRPTAQPRNAQHGEVVRSVEPHDRRDVRRPVDAVDTRSRHAGDDVRVRDHDARLRDPPGPFDPEAAGDARDADDALRRADHVGVLRDRSVGGRDDRGRAEEDADRVDPLERLEEALRREHRVDLGQDRRPLYGSAQVGLGREIQEHRADGPAEEDTRAEPENQAGQAIEQPHPGDDAKARAQGPGDHACEPAHERPEEDRPAERDQRDVRRAVAEELRRDPGADVGAEGEAREREGAAEKARRHPVERRDRDDADDDPVGGGHVPCGYGPEAPIPAARLHFPGPGGVVQLVRTPACHAGGRGFESRRSRQSLRRRSGGPRRIRRSPSRPW